MNARLTSCLVLTFLAMACGWLSIKAENSTVFGFRCSLVLVIVACGLLLVAALSGWKKWENRFGILIFLLPFLVFLTYLVLGVFEEKELQIRPNPEETEKNGTTKVSKTV